MSPLFFSLIAKTYVTCTRFKTYNIYPIMKNFIFISIVVASLFFDSTLFAAQETTRDILLSTNTLPPINRFKRSAAASLSNERSMNAISTVKSVAAAPIAASIDGAIITFSSTKKMAVTVTIKSLADNEAVYTADLILDKNTIFPIYMNGYMAGEYQLQFEYENTTLTGTFTLNE